MDDKNYKSILTKSPFGFAYHKIIRDEQGIPVDYEFLEVNPAFERITGLNAKEIIGKTVCQVLPGIRENNFDWVQYYGDIALDGGESEFEQYSKPLSSWYKVHAYSDQKYYFSTVFIDITAQKSLSDIAATFNNFSAQTIDLQYVADKAREISGAAYAFLNKFDVNGRDFSTIAFSGMNKHIEKAISILGFDFRGKTWDYDPVQQKKIDNQKTTVFQQLTDLTGTVFPEKIITLLSKTLNIGQVAVVKTTRESTMLGDFTLIYKRGSQLKDHETIETYADLTGMLLSRIDDERKVIKEQARLKTITDNMTDLVWETDLQFNSTYTSPSVNRILGFSVEKYMQLTIEERLAPESVQTALPLMQEELEKENDPHVSKSRSRLVELEYYKKDGSIIPMESNISFVRDKNGKPVGLRGVSRDITERKRAELLLQEKKEELNQANQELIAAKEKVEEREAMYRTLFKNLKQERILLRTIIDSIPDSIYVKDLESRKVLANKANCQNCGVEKEEDIIGKNDFDIFRAEISEKLFDDDNKVLKEGISLINREEYIKRPNSDEKCLLTSKLPLYDDKGKIIGLVGIGHDITERKRAEQQIIEAKEKAEESDRLKSAFLANMSHEIRTPMNGILGFADLLKRPGLKGEKQQAYIEIIEKSGKRMLSIINDIVDISKIEVGMMELDINESNINEQMEYIYTFFKPEAESKGMKLSIKNPLPAKEAIINTDREKVYAILANLVKNAIKYSEKGSILMGYNLKTDTKAGELEFYVKDTGIGIPKDRQEAIFDRFIQADIANEMAIQGAGLGLAITKAYVEMLGGKIWVESEECKGSTFYFTLPYNTQPAAETIDRELSPSGKNDDVRNLKILIAEDDEVSEMLLDETVKMFGKEILKARTGVEAVEACRDNPDIDLIMMDIRMPGMDGYEASQQIRKFNKEVIIIAQTAYAQTGDREKSIESGCNEYLAKPINKDELLALIQKYFGK